MLVSTAKIVRLDIPHEPGEWIEIRHVTGQELDRASDAVTSKVMDQFGNLVVDIMSVDTSKAREGKTKDPKQAYDPTILLNAAIVNWSYEEEYTDENIAMLDGQTRDWLWKEVVERNTVPPA